MQKGGQKGDRQIPRKKEAPGKINLHIIVFIIFAVPVIGEQPETEKDRADDDDFPEKTLQRLDLAFYINRTDIPVFFIGKIRSDQ
jgi:hypothetical protein